LEIWGLVERLRKIRRNKLLSVIAIVILTTAGLAYYYGTAQTVIPTRTGSGSLTSTVSISESSSSTVSGTSSTTTASTSLPEALPPLFPRSPFPGLLQVVNLTADPSLGYEVVALQGLVARVSPRIFVITRSDDAFWLQFCAKTYGTSYVESSSQAVLKEFENYVQDPNGHVKVILYADDDPIYPAQVNMALTLAGVYGALPVALSNLSTIQQIYGASNVDIIQDLSGRFSDKLSAYSWLWNAVSSNVTRRVVSLSPSAGFGLNDYLVEFRSFIFEFNSSSSLLTTAESSFASTVFSNYPPDTPVLGFFGLGGEVKTVSFLSQWQMLMFPGEKVADLSFYSGLPEPTNLSQIPSLTTPTYDPSKTYVLFSFTQGNSLGFDLYFNSELWDQNDTVSGEPLRAEIPEAWQINPSAVELAPQMVTYYYETMTPNDSFYGGASGGAGYVHPDQLPDLEAYLNLSKAFSTNLGLNVYFLIQSQTTFEPSLYQEYVTDLAPAGILIKQPQGTTPTTVGSVPVISVTLEAPNTDSFTQADVNATVSSIQQHAVGSHFIFVFMPAHNPGVPFIKEVLSGLGLSYVPVRVDQFFSLYEESIS